MKMHHGGDGGCSRCDELSRQLAQLKTENAQLRKALDQRLAAGGGNDEEPAPEESPSDVPSDSTDVAVSTFWSPLSRLEMQRYSRQMLVPDFRVASQLQLRQARVLIIGAGGLGCPAALYLGAMGVGVIGLVDNDRVERSNLHRQIGHDEYTMGELKVASLAQRVRLLNPDVAVEMHATRFTPTNAAALVGAYDIVLDASDNPVTRYLVNAICAEHHKPLVSGSALGLEGQVTVFTYANDSACYRCLYPQPPRQPQSCAENGVLGVVPGIIGCLQALEAVKVIANMGMPLSGVQVLFDAYDTHFRRVKFSQQRRVDCPACGTTRTTKVNGIDAVPSCGQATDDMVELGSENRMDVAEFDRIRRGVRNEQYVLLDTRPLHQFEMVHFPEAINVPFDQLRRAHLKGELYQCIKQKMPDGHLDDNQLMLVICRRGVDSVTVAAWLVACGWKNVFNVEGGYTRYADDRCGVDKRFPMY